MESNKTHKIISFTDLTVWQEGHKLVLATYRVTSNFPKTEQFALMDQMRRAATSITSNIAEGFGRYNKKEKIQFYRIAYGSLTELLNQMIMAKDIGYITEDLFLKIEQQMTLVAKLINGLIRSISNLP